MSDRSSHAPARGAVLRFTYVDPEARLRLASGRFTTNSCRS